MSINCKLWEKRLAEVFGHRFHDSIIFLVFLSTLCATIHNLVVIQATQISPTLINSLEWCCREICNLQAEQGPDKANAILRVLVARTPSAVALMDLYGTHLLPSSSDLREDPLELNMLKARLRSDVLDDLERAGQYFEVLQNTSKYHASRATFLHFY